MQITIFRSGISPDVDTYLNGYPLLAVHILWVSSMPGLTSNPDSRPLPRGWTEHFDSQRKLWYYIDLDANPPRVTFVHPYDEPSSPRPSNSPPSSTTTMSNEGSGEGRRGSTTSTTQGMTREPSHRSRRATVAQQLYASSLTQGSRSSAVTGITSFPLGPSPSSSRRPSISNSINSDETGSSAAPLSGHSIPKAIASALVTSSRAPFGQHDPRNFFDCTRLSRGTRRMTYSGSPPNQPSGAVGVPGGTDSNLQRDANPIKSNVQALYHHTVAAPPFTARPGPSHHPPLPQMHRSPTNTSPDRSVNPASLTVIHTMPVRRINGFPPTNPSLVTPAIQPQRIDMGENKGYTAITHDEQLLLVPNPTDGRCWSPPPIDVDLDLQDSKPATFDPPAPLPSPPPHTPLVNHFIPRFHDTHSNPSIAQPKPTHPLNGVNLNLNQLQLRLGKFLKTFGFGSKTESTSRTASDSGRTTETLSSYNTTITDDSFYIAGSSTRA
ncbi:hypothetical protein BJ165DRAFT_512176 [Panaeolus papilionaceus]|nr:hypothetical protein BJ165DRAFT_512176 [Panaeolus papilionaceus]